MMKKALVTALAVAGVSAAGQALAWEEGELVVWINSDKGYNGLQAVGDRFAEELGVPVTVETPDAVTEKFQKEAAIGKGPDIFIWAHDRFGDWAKSGLIAPVDPSDSVRAKLDDFWGAVSYNGKTYGYPIAVEGPTQICNTDIVDEPYASWEDVREAAPVLAEQGKKPLLYWYNNAYFNYGVMPEGVDYGVFDSEFKAGNVACVINGPWAWGDYEKAGIDFVVGPYPTMDGESGRGFTGVLSAAVNASSPNQDLAVEFIENYMLTEDGLKTVNDDRALGAVTHKDFMAELSANNETLANAYAVWQNAEPMPNIPEMAAFWSNTEAALTAIVQGRQSAEAALNDAAMRIIE